MSSQTVRSNQHLCKNGSHLGDRILWFDGSITVEPSNLLSFLQPNIKLHVTEVTADVKAYNLLAEPPIDVKQRVSADLINPDRWNIPKHYMDIDLATYFDDRLIEWSGIDRDRRAARVSHELKAFREVDKEIVLRLMIYIVDTLTANNSVWGVGRGSSVSCFLLYLIGVHDIDSVEFDLNFSDFMKSA